jgi:S-adenosylmethionine decarboxylase
MKRTIYATLSGNFANNTEVYNKLLLATNAVGMTVLNVAKHEFYPQGLTASILLAESHVNVHTYPEENKAYIDCFSCGEISPFKVIYKFCEMMDCSMLSVAEVNR